MSIKGLDHIGVAVKDLDSAISLYRDILGMKLEGTHTLRERGVKVAFFSISGGTRVELLQPIDNESTIAKFLSNNGEGIHHMALKVQNIETMLSTLKKNGITLIDETPKAGAEGKKIAFIHPKSTKGVLLELCEGP